MTLPPAYPSGDDGTIPSNFTGEKGAILVVNETEDAFILQSVPLAAGMLEKATFSIAGTNLTINADGIAQIYNSTDIDATISRHTVAGQVISLTSLTNGQTAQVLVRDNAGTIEYFLNTGAKSNEIIEALYATVSNMNGEYEVDRFDNAYALSNFLNNRVLDTDRIKRLQSGGGLDVSNPAFDEIEISSGEIYVGVEKRALAAVNTSTDTSLLYDGLNNSSSITGWNNTQFVDSGGNLQTLTANRYAINWVFRVVSDESNTARIIVLLGGDDHLLTAAQNEPAPTYSVNLLDEFTELVGKLIIQKDASVPVSIEQIEDRIALLNNKLSTVATDATLTGNGTSGDPLSVAGAILSQDALPATPGSINFDPVTGIMGVRNNFAGSSLQVGYEQYVRVVNKTGNIVNDGVAVHLGMYNAIDDAFEIILSQADSVDNVDFDGLTTTVMNDNDKGLVTTFGRVNDLDTSSFASGDVLFIDEGTPGALTNTKPPVGLCIGKVGLSNVSTGFIQVLPPAEDIDIRATFNNLTDQDFIAEGANTPVPIALDNNETLKGLTHSETIDNSEVTAISSGNYYFTLEPQLNRSSGSSAEEIITWAEINTGAGFVAVLNSAVRKSAGGSGVTGVSPLTALPDLMAGDKIRFMAQVTNTALFLDFTVAAGSVPATPSVIVNIFRRGN